MANTYIAIGTKTLTSADATSVTFTSIPQTFNHLIVMGTAADNTSTSDLVLRLNNDATANYAFREVHRSGNSAPTQRTSTSTGDSLGLATFSDAQPNGWLGIEIVIPNYKTTVFYKHYLYRWNCSPFNNTSLQRSATGGGVWKDTSAITEVKLLKTGANFFAAGTKFTLYGLL
jgi:hypothetical protein